MMKAVVENGDVLVLLVAVGLVNAKDWIAVLDRLAVEEQIMQIVTMKNGRRISRVRRSSTSTGMGWMEGFWRGSGGRWAKLEARGPKVPGSGTLEGGRAGPRRAVETRDKGSG